MRKLVAQIRSSTSALFQRTRVEREMDEELRAHMLSRVDDLERQGLSHAEAERRAHVEFGGVERVKEECREARGTYLVETLMQDVRFCFRNLRKAPAFTATVVLTMALGIGATTALFSVLNGVLIDPLPYKQPARLVAIYSKTKGSRRSGISYPNFLDWVRDNGTFSSLAAFRPDDFDLTGMGEAERVKVEMVSASFFPLLGVKPVIGSLFTAKEDRIGGAPVVLLSARFWKQEFGGTRDVVGKTLDLNNTIYTIVGVIPSDFQYDSDGFQTHCHLFVPIGQWNDSTFRDRRASLGMEAVGRLKPGVTLARARADMTLVAAHLAQQFPEADKGSGVTILPLKQDIVGNIRPFLLLLFAAVGFVLLIACANVASLLLARSTSRTREFAIRAALGATQGRVIRQLLTESLVLAVAGGVLGLLVAAWGTQAALRALPEALPRASAVHLDARVLFFTLLVSILAGILFGLTPALRTRRVDLYETLKEGGRGSSGVRHRTQRIFVVAEMALAVVLLVGAGLVIRSLAKLWSVNPGFKPNHVLTFGLSSSSLLGTTPGQIRAALRRISQQLEAIPGIQAASLTGGDLPMSGSSEVAFWIAGKSQPSSPTGMKVALFYAVQPDYLKVMRITLIHGRFLSAHDNEHSVPVIVIDEQFARRYFGNQDPIGQRINLAGFGMSAEIVGIVGHVKQFGLGSDSSSPIQAQMYFPFAQVPNKLVPLLAHGAAVVVRTKGAPPTEIPMIRRAVQRLRWGLVVYDARTMEGIISNSLSARRFSMILLNVFASFALLLSCVGIYGVISYLTALRLHEISIRIVLGAEPRYVLGMVLGQGLRMALLGAAIGSAAALGLMQLMSWMLFDISAHDPVTFLTVLTLLVLVAFAASFRPAWRAMHVDPVIALRNE